MITLKVLGSVSNMLKVGIMQPYFFPYIGYWQLLNAVDIYVVYDDVNYINRGWVNRNRILINQTPQYFNLLLSGASQNKVINEIEISADDRHFEKLFRTLELNYKKAPYYYDTMQLIEKILNNPQKNLSKFLYDQIIMVAKYLDMDTHIVLSSTIDKDNSLHGEDKIIEICKKLNAEEYYNAMGGMALYSRERFLQNGIILKFLETNAIRYKQYGEEFVGNLSIIDVMMFNGKEQTKDFLKKYKLV